MKTSVCGLIKANSNYFIFERRGIAFSRQINSLALLNQNRGQRTLQLKYFSSQIDELSWAAATLKKRGEHVAIPAPRDPVIIDDKAYRTPDDKIKNLVEQILMLNVIEINQLLNVMQERLGISDEKIYMKTGLNRNNRDMSHIDAMMNGGGGGAPAAGGKSAAGAAPAAPAAEKTAFDLKLTVVDAKVKIKVIKEVRTITGLGLKEAKELVEKAPVVIKQGLKKEEVENFKKLLLEAGAQIEVL